MSYVFNVTVKHNVVKEMVIQVSDFDNKRAESRTELGIKQCHRRVKQKFDLAISSSFAKGLHHLLIWLSVQRGGGALEVNIRYYHQRTNRGI